MARYQPGQSGNPKGRPPGSKNRNTIRQTIGELLSGRFTIESLNKDLDALESRDRINALLRLLEFVTPRLKAVEANIEQPEEDKPLFDLGLLSFDERQEFYALYNKACGSNEQDTCGEQVKALNNG